ncbi:glycerol kinase GlpK [Gammaproteobacteria bacterium]|nr:glycerol kinase GlpK [Gammaproteobacteria bacterium]MDC0401684.1 glycerol kinase GlpK [Gammaproteobacteria bacterium]
MNNFLAIDQGTTSSRAIIFSPSHEPIRDSQVEYALSYPNDGWVEAEPSDILRTVKETLENVIKQSSEIISSCGITNQRETTIVWSVETGEPIYPAIVWQDRRTHELCKKLKDDGHEEMVRAKTGLVIDPYFSATKIKWILDNVDGARKDAEAGKLRFGTVDSFLVNKLSKEELHLTDVTNASRTMLFNINSMQWDEDLLNLFDIPRSMLPEVRSCDSDYGTLNIEGQNIAIKGVIGDQQSALVGQRCFNHGDMKSTYGTGCFLMVNTKKKLITLDEGLLTTVGYKLNNEINYAIEGSIYSCGNIIQWLRDKMEFFKDASSSEEFLNQNGFSNNIQFLPAFNGLAAPYWDSDVRGGFYGITQDASKNDMITAAFKSICYQTRDITELLIQNNIKINSLNVDGGMTANKTFCQLLSDSLMVNILKPANIESTALGACIVAQISQGENIDSIKSRIEDKYEPQDNLRDFLETDYRLWRNYIEKTISNIK